ncbi:hypothetical protein ACLB2K_043653 [Fragaria x ananassa]
MTGYAICYGCILVSVEPPETCKRRESPLWVYDVTLDEWSEVKVPTDDDSDFHYPFTDKAVVIDDTIYARSFEETVVAFSLMRKQMVDGSMEYSVDKPRKLHGLRTCFHLDPDCYSVSDCLVHLGGFNFCLVQSIQKYFDRQRVFITTFDIIYKEGKRRIRTLDTTMREVDISCLGQFYIESGFTLECEEGNEIVSTSSMMQPTDDPRLCKLQQAVKDKIRKQKRRRRQMKSKLSSRKITLLENLCPASSSPISQPRNSLSLSLSVDEMVKGLFKSYLVQRLSAEPKRREYNLKSLKAVNRNQKRRKMNNENKVSGVDVIGYQITNYQQKRAIIRLRGGVELQASFVEFEQLVVSKQLGK